MDSSKLLAIEVVVLLALCPADRACSDLTRGRRRPFIASEVGVTVRHEWGTLLGAVSSITGQCQPS